MSGLETLQPKMKMLNPFTQEFVNEQREQGERRTTVYRTTFLQSPKRLPTLGCLSQPYQEA